MPSSAPPPAVPPTAPAPPPPPSAPAPAPSAPAVTAPAACYPLTNGGNCYQPGEFCRKADRGASGTDGDGEPITCEDNDGWRWEAA